MSRITITGADENTPIWALSLLASAHPLLEIGLLYTASPEGRPRYPSFEWLQDAAEALSGRCALHVCGSAARRQLLAGELRNLTKHAPRVQVNGQLGISDVVAAAGVVETLITQHNEVNDVLASVALQNHALLFDTSGGKGLRPDCWPARAEGSLADVAKPVGYAGGLGPDDLAIQLPLIRAAAGAGWGETWVDMENRIRTDDWFDLGKAKTCAEIFERFMAAHAPPAQTPPHACAQPPRAT